MTLLYERQSESTDCLQRWNASQPNEQLPTTPIFQSPADLITMINSANDSFETKAMIEGMARMGLISCMGTNCSPSQDPAAHPLMVSILSAGDWATGKIMPIAQRVSYFEQNLDRKYDEDAHAKGQIDVPKQRTFFLHNEGSISQLISHNVKKAKDMPTCDRYPYFSNEKACFVLLPNKGKEGQFVNTTPFWVFDVPTSVIPSHTDIFQAGTVALLKMIVGNAMQSTDPLNLTVSKK